MNAYKIMLFIIIFNISVSAVTTLNIYSSAGNVHPSEDFSSTGYSGVQAVMDFVGWDLFASFITGAIAGVFLAYGLKVPGDSAFVYSTFSTFYLIKMQDALQIFWDMGSSADSSVQLAILISCTIFTFIAVIALLSFIMQLVKGPWATMD